MKQIAVAVIATMVSLTSDKQPANLYTYSNKKVAKTATIKNQQKGLKNAGDSIQKDCIVRGEFLHESMFFPHF